MARTPKIHKREHIVAMYTLRSEGFTFAEIGERMRCTPATVKHYCDPAGARKRGVPESVIRQHLPTEAEVAAAKVERKGLAKLEKAKKDAAQKAEKGKRSGAADRDRRLTVDELASLYDLHRSGTSPTAIGRRMDISPGRVRLYLHRDTATMLGVPERLLRKYLPQF